MSLAFNFRQHKSMQALRKFEKANSVIRHALDLRKKSQNLRIKVNSTDDIEDCDVLSNGFDLLLEKQIAALAEKQTTSFPELFKLEKALFSIELEIDLLSKQVNEADRWNNEKKQYRAVTNDSLKMDKPNEPPT